MRKRLLRFGLPALLALSVAGFAAACGNDDDEGASASGPLNVLGSTTIISDWVEQVGGEHVEVDSIVPMNTDVHAFVVAPGDIRKIGDADVVFMVGEYLESGFEGEITANASGRVVVLSEGMTLQPFPETHAHDDDHGHDDGDDHGHDDDGHTHDDGDDHGHDDDANSDDHGHDDGDDHGHDDHGNGHDDGDDHGHDDHGNSDDHGHDDHGHDDHGSSHDDGDDHGHDDHGTSHNDGDDHGHDDRGNGHDDGDDHGHDDHGNGHDDGDDHGHDDHAGGNNGDDDHGHSHDDGHVHGEFDPHIWMDIDLVIQAVERIRDTLVEMDPDNADDYGENADAYIATLRDLDDELTETFSGIPENQRYVVTFHDAYGYLASRYDLTLLGFVVENPEAQPSASRYAELVDAIRENNVPYIYKEPQFDARVIEQLARDTGAEVRSVPSDALTDDAPDYVSLMRAIASGIAAE